MYLEHVDRIDTGRGTARMQNPVKRADDIRLISACFANEYRVVGRNDGRVRETQRPPGPQASGTRGHLSRSLWGVRAAFVCRWLSAAVAAVEFLHLSGGVDDAAPARPERV
jgi:hypothetical protein